jgi:acetoacetyl-CoA synthetase
MSQLKRENMAGVSEGIVLWEPSDHFRESSNLMHYSKWLQREKGLRFDDYDALWKWSVTELEGFWSSVWEFFDVKASCSYQRVLTDRRMPGARWFDGARLNYAEHVFRNATVARPALVFRSETRPTTEVSWAELSQQVASVAASLRRFGVKAGDRLVGYVPNIPEAVIAFLACASIGAVWSSCSPDFGSPSVIDRFKQIEPKVLFAVDGYRYSGKEFDRRKVVADLQEALPTLEQTIVIPYLNTEAGAVGLVGALPWRELTREDSDLAFEQVQFEHPLWILYSSGTTGLPKPIVQSQGGILLEHLKSLRLHLDLEPKDRFFWFTTTGWMMWNFLVGGLLLGTTIVLYDGCPTWPDAGALWKFAEESRVTFFGASAAYVSGCIKDSIEPISCCDLGAIKCIGVTGSPLASEGFRWIYQCVKQDVWLNCISGGTDVCTAFIGGCPLLPVSAGQMQCRWLGAEVQAFDEGGEVVTDEVGELVITKPMPSMPLSFWNDLEGSRYRESYFEMYPGVWRHGDWVKIKPDGSVIIYGRSDSTINRMGVRMGTSELYRVVEEMPEILDSLAVDLEILGGAPYMSLFVVLKEGAALGYELCNRIRDRIRDALSPRHVPDEIVAIQEVPRTLNGKKLEVPVKKILAGVPLEKAANLDAVSKPDSLGFFVNFAAKLKAERRLGGQLEPGE